MVATTLTLRSSTTSPRDLGGLIDKHFKIGNFDADSGTAFHVFSGPHLNLYKYADSVFQVAEDGNVDNISATLLDLDSLDIQPWSQHGYIVSDIRIKYDSPKSDDAAELTNIALQNLRLTQRGTLFLLSERGFTLERDGDLYHLKKGPVRVKINTYQPEFRNCGLPNISSTELNYDFFEAVSAFGDLKVNYNLELKLERPKV